MRFSSVRKCKSIKSAVLRAWSRYISSDVIEYKPIPERMKSYVATCANASRSELKRVVTSVFSEKRVFFNSTEPSNAYFAS